MYYIKGANKIYGPVSVDKIRTLLSMKRITLDVLVSTDQKDWHPLKTIPEFASSNTAQSSSTTANSSASAATHATVENNTLQPNHSSAPVAAPFPLANKPDPFNLSSGNKSGSISFDFLQNNNNNNSNPFGNSNNPFAQQPFSTTPTPVESVPVQQVAVPSVPVPEEKWFLCTDGVNGHGPYPTSHVVSMIQNGQIQANNLAWKEGENAVQISVIPSFANYFNGSVGFNSMNKSGQRGRRKHHGPPHSRTTYILLGIFFGVWGIHNFYAGYSGRGVAQLICTLCCVGLIFVPIWSLIEICTETKDANGVPFI